jgi:hypothetical protein
MSALVAAASSIVLVTIYVTAGLRKHFRFAAMTGFILVSRNTILL